MRMRYVRMTVLNLASGVFLTLPSFAQVSSTRVGDFMPNNAVVEVKPLPTALSFIPGVRAVGVGAEFNNSGNYAAFTDVYLLDSNLPNRLRREGNEDETPVLQIGQGYAADVGVRYYYTSATADSWFSQAKLGYAYSLSQWGYQDEQVDHSFRTIVPGLGGGYRWVWTNSLLVRVGAGIDGNIVQENKVTPTEAATAATNDAQNEIEGAALAAVTPMIDLGVGYMF